MITRAAILLAILGSSAYAEPVRLPSHAKLTASTSSALDSYAFAVGPWTAGTTPQITAEGTFEQQAWQLSGTGLTSLQMMRPLREQLRNDGYRVLFECADQACGGFDFRFSLTVLAPPQMQINLGDFRYLVAQAGSGEVQKTIAIITSHIGQSGYIHITNINAETAQPAIFAPPQSRALQDIEQVLDTSGHATLSDLAFETGSSQLGQGPFESLIELAGYLRQFPNRKVALVGHTDSSGGLAANIQLSKRRAGSVLERLVTQYSIPRDQLEAEGMGYLAPVASNLSEHGREANRRVEVIITTTDE